MGNDQKSSDIQALLTKRGETYAEAWLTAGRVLEVMLLNDKTSFHRIAASGFLHNFVLIVSKLCRALATPRNIDHWRDIAGYATLIVQHLEQEEQTHE